MRYKERYTEIIELIQQNRRVLVGDLAQRFAVSEVTIRKDLGQLEVMGLCRRFHSGAVAVDSTGFDIPIKQKVTENSELKARIAQVAVEMIGDAHSIILDAGSSTQLIARLLKDRERLRVVTNSLLVGSELADSPSIDLLLTGGNLRHESQACVGPISLDCFRKVNVDIVFLGAMGVSAERGLSSATILEAQGKEAMIAAAARKIVVADHTKLGKVSFAPFADLREIDMLITDSDADEGMVQSLRNRGLDVVLA